jgi:hypothetical protein
MATLYELELIKELGNVEEARRSYPDATEFIAEEEARIRGQLEALQSKPRRFVLSHGDFEQIERYLGFGGNIVWTEEPNKVMREQQQIIEVPAEHAEWQANRLASGLHGGYIYETLAEARGHLA